MTKEALKLALEALEANQPANYCMNSNGERFPMMHEDPFRFERNTKAITAIKEALAQPEQERFLVATIGNWGRVEWVDGIFPSLGDKMYSAPRTWVGLTEDEAFACQGRDYFETYKAIGAKLKEKNT